MKTDKKIFLLFLFAVSFAFLESAVVVYLRKIYYPAGFCFPLKIISPDIFSVEILRELATLLMIFSIAFLAGKNFPQRLAFFLFIFAVWDIFYYIFLKLILNWPQSLLTWDILFLIPVSWIGPVLAPVLCSLTMLLMTAGIIYVQKKHEQAGINLKEWAFILLGAFVIFMTFIYDYTKLIVKGGFLKAFSNLALNSDFQKAMSSFVPDQYNWIFFIAGEILILTGLFLFVKRNLKSATYDNGKQ
jgi:hypothetical protein